MPKIHFWKAPATIPPHTHSPTRAKYGKCFPRALNTSWISNLWLLAAQPQSVNEISWPSHHGSSNFSLWKWLLGQLLLTGPEERVENGDAGAGGDRKSGRGRRQQLDRNTAEGNRPGQRPLARRGRQRVKPGSSRTSYGNSRDSFWSLRTSMPSK